MVSIDTNKRYQIENSTESTKKAKFNTHYDIHSIISINSPFFNENLAKLQILFPLYSTEDLSKALENSHNSFNLTVHNLQKQEKLKIQTVNIETKAQNFIIALSNTKNINEAHDIAKKLLEGKEPSTLEEDLHKENSLLKDHIITASSENKILKRAVAKLHENIRTSSDKDKEIDVLRRELENERYKAFALLSQLTRATTVNELKLSRELF
ncbi:hypothetical protein SteCoe_17010 [Stentor coeruleus]|uniref:Uncharacterized protein n=1 Tax=Stentor coeruleus TaxID=5963 RepID=A0A1R2BZZ7_9CILI|nr:hypothetical protein SteCoe_17010 [Stentor coeruleus]